MSPKQSTARLIFYIATAMLATFSGGIMSVDFSDWRAVALFVSAIIGAGLTAARGYLDMSPSQVVKDIAATIDFTKFPPTP